MKPSIIFESPLVLPDESAINRIYRKSRRRLQAGVEGMSTGFHERFAPQGIKDHDARPDLDSSSVQRAAERLKLDKK